jgi:hypothetical protein
MREKRLITHPVDADRVAEYLAENPKDYIKTIKIRKYIYADYEFYVVVDGNHRTWAMQLDQDLDYYDEKFFKYLDKYAIIEKVEYINFRQFLFLSSLHKLMKMIIGGSKWEIPEINEFNKMLDLGYIDNTFKDLLMQFLKTNEPIEMEFLRFFFNYVYSDQTEGWGFFAKGIIKFLDNDNKFNIQGIISKHYYNNYNSCNFDVIENSREYKFEITDNKLFLYDEDGKLIFKSEDKLSEDRLSEDGFFEEIEVIEPERKKIEIFISSFLKDLKEMKTTPEYFISYYVPKKFEDESFFVENVPELPYAYFDHTEYFGWI